MTRKLKFKPVFSPEVELVLGDGFSFQCAGKDEDGKIVMYNDSAEVIEDNGELVISHNGTKYNPYYFFHCVHLDGDISMDYIKKTHNWKTMERHE